MVTRRQIDELARRARSSADRVPAPSLATPANIVEFAMDSAFLGQELFPRQGTILKIAAGEVDALTGYDRSVLAEWGAGFSPRIEGDIAEYVRDVGYNPGHHRAC